MLAFVTGLLHRGEVLLLDPPDPEKTRAPLEPEVTAVLERAFARHALDVAGPRIAFDETFARRAAELVQVACWLLVHSGAARRHLGAAGDALGEPRTASEHLSADLFLRYLPLALRRARALDGNDPLGHELALILRRFPLSGVLAPIQEGPLAPLELGGHEGLWLLYAERLAGTDEQDRASRLAPLAWAPPEGPVRERLELVLAEQGREGSSLLARRESPVREETDALAATESDDEQEMDRA